MDSALESIISQTAFKVCFAFQVAAVRGGTRARRGVGLPADDHPRRHAAQPSPQGWAVQMQVDPIRPTVKAPGSNRLKL